MIKKCFSQSLNNDGRVSFDEKQCLTPKQKEQARKNIGALGKDEVPEGGVEEAPKNGIQYGRKDGSWTPVVDKVYEGIDEIHVDNDKNTISLDKSNIASKTELETKQDKLIAGSHIEIDENNTIKVVGEFGKVYEGEGKVTVNNTTNKISVDLSEQATKTELSEISSVITNETQERIHADIDIQEEIDSLEISSDVSYVVNSFSDLPTSATTDEYAKVLNDSTHENKTSYYQYKSGVWTYVGSIGPYVTNAGLATKIKELKDSYQFFDVVEDGFYLVDEEMNVGKNLADFSQEGGSNYTTIFETEEDGFFVVDNENNIGSYISENEAYGFNGFSLETDNIEYDV